MKIINIQIQRVIAHEVIRAALMDTRPPVLSDELITLDDSSKELIGKRLVSTMGDGSHSVDVTVDDSTQGSPFDHITAMLDVEDSDFIKKSQHLANTLSGAQTVGKIKSGSAIFIQGACVIDGNKLRFMAIIKADSDEGLSKQIIDDEIVFKLIKDMILGESQKLFKVAFFVEETDPDKNAKNVRKTEDFSIKVFDHLMQNSGDGNAATYFYKTFLKCRLAENSSRQTKLFYETARDFINNLTISQGDKVKLRVGLISYLQGNRSVLTSRDFATEILPATEQDSFIKTCKKAGIIHGITKDLDLLKGKMRRQSVKFTSEVTLYASPEIFRDAVIIGKSTNGWTDIKIRGSIENIP